MAERKAFLLRLDPAVLEALQRWADDDLRSLNGQIEFLLRRALTDAGRAREDPATEGDGLDPREHVGGPDDLHAPRAPVRDEFPPAVGVNGLGGVGDEHHVDAASGEEPLDGERIAHVGRDAVHHDGRRPQLVQEPGTFGFENTSNRLFSTRMFCAPWMRRRNVSGRIDRLGITAGERIAVAAILRWPRVPCRQWGGNVVKKSGLGEISESLRTWSHTEATRTIPCSRA